MFNSVLGQKVVGAVQAANDDQAAPDPNLILQLIQLVLQFITGGGLPCGGVFGIRAVAQAGDPQDTILAHTFRLVRRSDFDGNAAKLAAKIRDAAQAATDDDWTAFKEEVEAYALSDEPTEPDEGTTVCVTRGGRTLARLTVAVLAAVCLFTTTSYAGDFAPTRKEEATARIMATIAGFNAPSQSDPRAAAIARIAATIEAIPQPDPVAELRNAVTADVVKKLQERYGVEAPPESEVASRIAQLFADDAKFAALTAMVEKDPKLVFSAAGPLGTIISLQYDLSSTPEIEEPPVSFADTRAVIQVITPESWFCPGCAPWSHDDRIDESAWIDHDALPYQVEIVTRDGFDDYPRFGFPHHDDTEPGRIWHHWFNKRFSVADVTDKWKEHGALGCVKEDETAIVEGLPPDAQPTPWQGVRRALKLADLDSDTTYADVGCGYDARFCIEAVRTWDCEKAIGIEFDPQRAESARQHVEAAGLADRIEIIEADARTLNFAKLGIDVATVYVWPEMLAELSSQLDQVKRYVSLQHRPRGVSYVNRGDMYLVRNRVNYNGTQYSQVPANTYYNSCNRGHVAHWGGQTYTSPVCNSSGCTMCNSIRAQLAL